MKKQYYSYDKTIEFFQKAESIFPELIEILIIGKTYEERDIILVKISLDVKNADNKPALLYTGTVHAREWIGNELGVKLTEYITENYQFDPRLEKTLQNSIIYLVPSLNPDGFEYSRKHFSFWRKNRRKNSDGTFGVDLNRNFSIGFQKVTDKSSNIYGGEEPFSEAETGAIKKFVDSHPNITIALDYHSQGNVFFPAHKFRHEAEIDGTDMNTLCANMSHEIQKVSGRTYGIHRGKPPTKLISGSGREYYYSKGIIAIVVEVGTKNIPDYAKSMIESVNEHIPALLKAFSETVNYSTFAPKRVDNFSIESVNIQEITLSWNYELREDIYFEIYRNREDKQASGEHNRVGVTKSNSFTDIQLESGSKYYYTIRAVNINTKIKSPFTPAVKGTTLLNRCDFSKRIFPIKSEIGYLAENSQESNFKHFGHNSLFIGVNKFKGISNAVLSFPLDQLPENIIIESASLSLYPMNRVGAKIEKYGEWNISILKQDLIFDIYNFDEVENCETVGTVGDSLKSQNLTQGIWNSWKFSKFETTYLQDEVAKGKVLFRVDGAKTLPLGEDSQMMQFDIGYGKFGGGLEYRPFLDIKYKIPSEEIVFSPTKVKTIFKDSFSEDILKVGFDKSGFKTYGITEFNLSELPKPETTVITEAYIELKNGNIFKGNTDIRFSLELVEVGEDQSYNSVQNRNTLGYIGYDIANSDLLNIENKFFIFDSNLKLELENIHKSDRQVQIIIRVTSPDNPIGKYIEWIEPKLLVRYIKKRKEAVSQVDNLNVSKEKGMIKLSWDNPEEKDFKGCYVIRNSFHPPKNFSDGVKLYGGIDSYTYDNFASFDKDKYYAVFTYDNVPNFSEPKIVKYLAE